MSLRASALPSSCSSFVVRLDVGLRLNVRLNLDGLVGVGQRLGIGCRESFELYAQIDLLCSERPSAYLFNSRCLLMLEARSLREDGSAEFFRARAARRIASVDNISIGADGCFGYRAVIMQAGAITVEGAIRKSCLSSIRVECQAGSG